MISRTIQSCLFAALLLMALPVSAKMLQGGRTSAASPTYTGACDVLFNTACAEAWAVDYSPTASYSGPLFQLWNGSATLDIGQTAGHVADMTTWSAFCGGVASNCKYSKIYATRVTNGTNDLIPSIYNGTFGLPVCSSGGPYVCAAPFTIDTGGSGSGLPVLSLTTGQLYTLVGDNVATGINGGTASMSIIAIVQPINSSMCCGSFGIYHFHSAPDIDGTDFGISLGYGPNTPPELPCDVGNYCFGFDLEGEGPANNYSTTFWPNILVTAWNDASTGLLSAYLNSHLVVNAAPPGVAPVNAGTSVHVGAGGDLSQPAPTIMRLGILINGMVSTVDRTAIYNWTIARYPGLSFP